MFYVFKMVSDKGNIDKKVRLKSRKCEKVAQLILVFFLFFISQDERKEDKQQVLIPDMGRLMGDI